jgi:hypothetical protein
MTVVIGSLLVITIVLISIGLVCDSHEEEKR